MSNDQYFQCKSRGCLTPIKKMTACNRASGATGGAVLGGIIGGIFCPWIAIPLAIMGSGAGASQSPYCPRCRSEMEEEETDDG